MSGPRCRTSPDQLDKRPDKVFRRILDRAFRRQERSDPLEVSLVNGLGHIPQEGVQLFLGTEVFARDKAVPRDRFRDVGCPPVDGHTSRREAVENFPRDESGPALYRLITEAEAVAPETFHWSGHDLSGSTVEGGAPPPAEEIERVARGLREEFRDFPLFAIELVRVVGVSV